MTTPGQAIAKQASGHEWHEGTQIEPPVPKQIGGFTYLNYLPLAPDHYLNRTAYWVCEFEKRRH